MKRPAHITLVNGIETSAIDIADRGLAYGDGLFETMRVIRGKIPLFSYHLSRFLKGVEVLGMGDVDLLAKKFERYSHGCLHEIRDNACLESCLLKIIVTRGSGGRGYLPPDDPNCQFIVQVFDLPKTPVAYLTQGILVRECTYRLAYQPQLVGIKHLNRLDQVLASQEIINENEGLLADYDNNVIEGTRSNVLFFKDKKVFTPDLTGSGVKGVLRQALIESGDMPGQTFHVQAIPLADLSSFDGMAMLNSVFGLWPVKSLLLESGKSLNFQITSSMQSMLAYLNQRYAY